MMSQSDPPGDDEDGGGGYGRPPKAEEAFLLQLAKSGVEGGGAATRTALGLIEEIAARRSTQRGFISSIVCMIVAPGSVTSTLAPLRMARKLDPYRETARMALEPWLVQAALAPLNRKPIPPPPPPTR